MKRAHRLGHGIVLSAACALVNAQPRANSEIWLEIESQPLEKAVYAWSRQTGYQVLLAADGAAIESLSPDVRGAFTPKDALSVLLARSTLTFQFVNDRAVAIRAANQGAGATRSRNASDAQEGSEQAASSAAAPLDGVVLEEVTVTAQKREERLIDTPQSISVVSSDALSRIGAVQFRDFANTVPGLTFATAGAGFTQVSLRGVTTGQDVSPTVGIYVDEVPFGSSSGFAQGAQLALDVGLFDIEQIEILRGPQGTLYGASTMGGLIKYVTRAPETDQFRGQAQTGVSGTHQGGTNYNFAAAINAPLVPNKAALRASGFKSRDAGYIDNELLGRDDVNRSDVYGGRLDFLVQPTEQLTVRLGGFLQNISRDGLATADYTAEGVSLSSNLEQSNPLAQPFDQKFRLVSGVIDYKFGSHTLTSISSYQTMDAEVFYDYSRQFLPVLALIGLDFGSLGDAQSLETNKFTQEVRLASNGSGRLQWLIGGFYTKESSSNSQVFVQTELDGQPSSVNLLTATSPSSYKEYAGFTDVTYRFSEKLDVSAGVRVAHNKQEYTQIASGLLVASLPKNTSDDDVTTYLANARYYVSERATGYVRFATGYRAGGPNFVVNDPVTGLPVAPPTFEPDQLRSYEIGFKGESAGRRYGIDLAAYYIDWENIQILDSSHGFTAYANAGAASIRGAELALNAHPIAGFSATGAFAYQDAALSESAPLLGGVDGERLPNVPKFTAAVTADYQFTEDGWKPSIGTTLRYVSSRRATFDANPLQYRLPSYTTVDARAGFIIGAVNAQLYVHNALDERGRQNAFLYTATPGAIPVSILQPRTVGLRVSMDF